MRSSMRFVADVDEAAGAGESGAKSGDIDVAQGIRLGETEEGDIESTPVIEIELVGLVHHRVGIDASAKVHSTLRNATYDAGLGGQRDKVDDPVRRCRG